jgi:hypothetical protein
MGKITARSRSSRWALGVALASSFALAHAHGGGPSAVAAAPTLRWKFTPGEALHYQMDQKTVTELKNQEQTIKTTLTQTTEMTWKVESVDASGAAEIAQTFDRIKTRIESPFGVVEFDSKDSSPPKGPIAAGIVPLLKALVGSTFHYKMSPQGEPSDIKVPEGLVKALKESGATAPNGGMFSEDGFKNMINEMSFVFPATPLDKPWKREVKTPSPIGTMKLEKTYKYVGTEDNKEKISLEVKVSFEPAPNAPEFKLGPNEGKGVFLFDNKAGRVVSADVNQKLEVTFGPPEMQVNQITDTTSHMKLVKVDPAPAK